MNDMHMTFLDVILMHIKYTIGFFFPLFALPDIFCVLGSCMQHAFNYHWPRTIVSPSQS